MDRLQSHCFGLVLQFRDESLHITKIPVARSAVQGEQSRVEEQEARKEQIAKVFGFLSQVAGVVNLLCFSTPHFQFFSNLVTLTSHKHCLLLTRNVDCLTEMNLRMTQR